MHFRVATIQRGTKIQIRLARVRAAAAGHRRRRAGAVLRWSGTYYWRVRFGDDTLDFEKFLTKLWKLGKVELMTIKDLA